MDINNYKQYFNIFLKKRGYKVDYDTLLETDVDTLIKERRHFDKISRVISIGTEEEKSLAIRLLIKAIRTGKQINVFLEDHEGVCNLKTIKYITQPDCFHIWLSDD